MSNAPTIATVTKTFATIDDNRPFDHTELESSLASIGIEKPQITVLEDADALVPDRAIRNISVSFIQPDGGDYVERVDAALNIELYRQDFDTIARPVSSTDERHGWDTMKNNGYHTHEAPPTREASAAEPVYTASGVSKALQAEQERRAGGWADGIEQAKAEQTLSNSTAPSR